jgi:EmrB/QacA subfamily drug resistance transporter
MNAPEIKAGVFAERSPTQQILALTGMVLTLLTAAMSVALSSTAMPRAVASLNGFARYPWTTTSLLLTTTIAMPVSAKLSDLYGRKWLYLGSTGIFVVSLLLCGASGTLPMPLDGMNQLIVARGLLGIGDGAIIALTFTLVADLFPPSERGRYQGLLAAVNGVAYTVGPSLGGWITDHLSWRWTYYVDVPLGIMAIVAVHFTLPDFRPHRVHRSIDWAGIATLCGWLVPLLLALTWVGQSSWSAPRIRALLIASAVFLAAFLLVEKRAAEPLFVLDLFRDRRISLMSANFFLLGISLFGVAVYLPLFLQGVLSESAAKSGLVFTQYTFALIAGNVIGGQMLSRTGQYRLFAIGGAGLAACGLFLLSRMDGGATQLEVLRNAIICGIGFATTIGGAIGLALFGTILLRLYHLHVDALIPPGAPKALTQAFDNPLQLVFARPNLEPAFAQIANGRVLLANLLEGVRMGLLSALRFVFLFGAGIMTVSFALNLLLHESPVQKES